MKTVFPIALSGQHVELAKALGEGDASRGIEIALSACPIKPKNDVVELVIPAVLERFGTLPFTLAKSGTVPKGGLWIRAENETGGQIGYALRSCHGRRYCGYQLTGKMDAGRRCVWQLIEI